MKLKQIPEDFVVWELPFSLNKKKPTKNQQNISRFQTGEKATVPKRKAIIEKYIIFTLEKTDRDFFTVLDLMSKKLGIRKDQIGYSGIKDKKAVTYQKISVPKIPIEKLRGLDIDGIELSDFQDSDQPIRLNSHIGNKFKITVRDLDKIDDKRIEQIKIGGFLNLFDEQRFGQDGNNHIVGRFLLKRDFEKAVSLIDQNYREDPITFIKKLPKTLSLLYIHAYQSYIWNEVAKNFKTTDDYMPIVGYDTVLENYQSGIVIGKLLEKDGIEVSDFKFRTIPHLTCRGQERQIKVKPSDLKWELQKDELNENKLKAILEFKLRSGSYATSLIKQLFK